MAHFDFDSAFENIFGSMPKDDSVKADITSTGNASPIDDLFVDMGLSVKWAKCNLGASHEFEDGDYYAWGEISTKEIFEHNSYLFPNKKITTLPLSADAANAKYGGKVRIPTKQEWLELRDMCMWEHKTINNRNGCLVTSKITGNSIFLPPSGDKAGDFVVFYNTHGSYWSSTGYDESNACLFYFIESDATLWEGHYDKPFGRIIRPVCE